MKMIRSSSTPRVFKCSASYTPNNASGPTSDAAEEGTAVHWLAHCLLTDTYTNEQTSPNGVVLNGEMFHHARKYVQLVTPETGFWQTEQEVEFVVSENVKVQGHIDHVAYDPDAKTLTISDLKYGYRIVEPQENWQLLSYAFGWMSCNSAYPVENIRLRIYQPRPYHPAGPMREWRLSYDQLSHYWKKLTDAVWEIENAPTLRTGDHCRYCHRVGVCPAAREAAGNAVDVGASTASFEALTDDRLAYEIKSLKRGRDALNDRLYAIEEEAQARIKQNRKLPGLQLVRPQGARTWKKGVDVELMEALSGKDMKNGKLITPAEAERRRVDQQLIDLWSTRRLGKLTLTEVDIDAEARGIFGNGSSRN